MPYEEQIKDFDIKREKSPDFQIKQNDISESVRGTENPSSLFDNPEEALKKLIEMESQIKQEFNEDIRNFNYEDDFEAIQNSNLMT